MTVVRAVLLTIVMIVSIAGCLIAPAVDAENKPAPAPLTAPLDIGFIMSGPISDLGWNSAHERARIYLERELKGKVHTIIAEKVSEGAEAERVMEKMIAQGNRVLFSTSYGFMEPALRVAQRHPDVLIMQCWENKNLHPLKNVGTYFASYYEPIYVIGTVAGRMTKKNEIGYVAAHPIPALLLSLNSFTLGARSVNPKVKVRVVWTNSWSDPLTETEATRSLADQGVDTIVTDLSCSITAVQAAEKCHVYSAAYNADLRRLAPNGWLTGCQFNWGPLYVEQVQSMLNHTWQAKDYRYGAKYGYLQLSSFGQAVSPTVQTAALDLMNKIKDGQYVIFKGPIKDRDGKVELPAK